MSRTQYTKKAFDELLADNERLKREVEYLRSHPTIARGIRGETILATLLRAARTAHGASHDLVTQRDSLRLEVKYSSLLNTYSSQDQRVGRRWVWTKLFGEMGNKQFERLLLIGDVDRQFLQSYADPESPYVIFDVPYADALELSNGLQPGRRSRLHLNTNPRTVKSWKSKTLFEDFQVSTEELLARYALS